MTRGSTERWHVGNTGSGKTTQIVHKS